MNVAVVCPEGTVTEFGTVAAGVLLDKVTVVPPEPAGPVSVTVPVEGAPPCTEAGLSEIDTNAVGVIVSVAD